jgi:hypothetical protein
VADVRSERWRTTELNGGGHRICPEGVVATGRVVGLVPTLARRLAEHLLVVL